MEKQSKSVYIYRPKEPLLRGSSEPKAILLLGWTAARDSHLLQYVEKYRAIFPSSTIILVKADVYAQLSAANARRNVQPAITPLRELLSSAADKPELLVHLFSNGGSTMLSTLYNVYAESATDDSSRLLPLHVTIFDSAPARRWEYKKIIAALVPGVAPGWQRLIAMPIFHLLAIWKIGVIRLGTLDSLTENAKSHNDHTHAKEASRVYFFGDKDAVVSAHHVLTHAAEAEKKGFEVRTELFSGSTHVSHMKADPERYWRIVEEAWGSKAKL